MESSLPVSIRTFLLLCVGTKALMLAGTGTLLTAFCICSESMLLPYLTGLGFWAGSWALWRLVPAGSRFSAVRYFNAWGILRSEQMYGSYLNLSVGNRPVSRICLSWIFILAVLLTGTLLSFRFFTRGGNLQLKRVVRPTLFPFRPYVSLLRHESYKLLITGHGLIILIVFSLLIAFSNLNHSYIPSVQEKYYQDLMLQLEGSMTDSKEAIIQEESQRYEEAFAEIERIDQAIADGELNEDAGETLKAHWNAITAFYPEFQRVEEQAERVRGEGGAFLYDTGYLYLFGISGRDLRGDYLLLAAGTVLAFSHAVSMEHASGAWSLLCATVTGKWKVLRQKAVVCALTGAVFSLIPFLFRLCSVLKAFPMHGLLFPARSIPYYADLPAVLPVWTLVLGKLLGQVITGLLLTAAAVALSAWRKNHVQALFFGFLLLCVPAVLSVLGFDAARFFSLYPLFAWH